MKRLAFYMVILVAIIMAVVTKQSVIKREKQAITVSIENEYKKYGIPVYTKTVQQGVLIHKKRFTVKRNGEHLKGFVSNALMSLLKKGMSVDLYTENNTYKSKIIDLSSNPSIQYGLYTVQIATPDGGHDNSFIADAEFARGNLNIIVPTNVIVTKEHNQFVWVVIDNKSKLVPVTLGEKEGFQVEVLHGLKIGDTLITKGFHLLSDGKSVRLLNEGV